MATSEPARRIVCLTDEPVEILYLLGEEARVVGISSYTRRPPQARRDKPVVSGFAAGNLEKICALEPDLVIGFSDVQAKLASDLVSAGLQVLIFNQRSLDEILGVIRAIARLVDRAERGEDLVQDYRQALAAARKAGEERSSRPRVYFEEWDEPRICGIGWVSELIEIAGGRDVFRDRARCPLASERIVADDAVVAAAPEIYIASWCGKAFDRESLLRRPGWNSVPAIRDEEIHEIDSGIILQPGPACLTDGLRALQEIIGTRLD